MRALLASGLLAVKGSGVRIPSAMRERETLRHLIRQGVDREYVSLDEFERAFFPNAYRSNQELNGSPEEDATIRARRSVTKIRTRLSVSSDRDRSALSEARHYMHIVSLGDGLGLGGPSTQRIVSKFT